ncbi:hypothetical protein AcV5_001707 [Taiwanofungus camphoratus]|nr:hypothetical protein AcV5_001707 [Antrodia cinnamomea]
MSFEPRHIVLFSKMHKWLRLVFSQTASVDLNLGRMSRIIFLPRSVQQLSKSEALHYCVVENNTIGSGSLFNGRDCRHPGMLAYVAESFVLMQWGNKGIWRYQS